MTPRMTRARFLSATLALGLMTPGLSALTRAAPAGAPPAAETTMKKMMEAVKTKSFDSFMATPTRACARRSPSRCSKASATSSRQS